MAVLTNLLSHENTDIAIDVVDIIRELTDEDVLDNLEEDEEREEDLSSKGRMAMGELIDELVSCSTRPIRTAEMQLNNSVMDLLVANLGRLNEDEDTDRDGVFGILGVFDNLMSFMPPIAEQIVADTQLLPWVIKRLQKEEFDSNKQYASEILSMMLQDSREINLRVGELNGMEVLLQAAAVRSACQLFVPCADYAAVPPTRSRYRRGIGIHGEHLQRPLLTYG